MNVSVLINRAGRVIAGHGRIMACQQLGWTDVPTISLEHLTEAQARAFMIADNRLTENSEWDERLLAEQLKELWSWISTLISKSPASRYPREDKIFGPLPRALCELSNGLPPLSSFLITQVRSTGLRWRPPLSAMREGP
jgi:hypothetical protein